jgi:hypothetical protein
MPISFVKSLTSGAWERGVKIFAVFDLSMIERY